VLRSTTTQSNPARPRSSAPRGEPRPSHAPNVVSPAWIRSRSVVGDIPE
jgi:hypothetical protein